MGWEGRWKSEVRGTCLDIHDSDLAEDFRLRGEAVPALAFVHEADAHALIQNALGEVVSGAGGEEVGEFDLGSLDGDSFAGAFDEADEFRSGDLVGPRAGVAVACKLALEADAEWDEVVNDICGHGVCVACVLRCGREGVG